MTHTPYPETLVNSTTTGDQFEPIIAPLAGGGWVVLWGADGQDGDSNGIYQQAYNADGTALGGETQVNTYTTGSQTFNAITALADGGWVATWQSSGQDGSGDGIYQQAYNADGTAMGDETRVNTYTTGSQASFQTTALADGGWVVAWFSVGQDGDGLGVYQQAYDADGTARGDETRVNSTTAGHQTVSAIATLADGGWVVTWSSNGQDGSGYGVYQQVYHADGTPLDGEVQVNTTMTGDQSASKLASLAGGGWVVTWSSPQDGGGSNIYQQAYDADGTLLGSEERVNTSTTGSHYARGVIALENGGWVVTWLMSGQDGAVYQQAYKADGTALGGETRIGSYTEGNQDFSGAVVPLADGGWVVVWNTDGQDGDGWGVYQQIYNAGGTARGDETLVNTTTAGNQYEPSAEALADGGWLVSWYSQEQGGDDYDIYQQRYDADGQVWGLNHAPTAANRTITQLTNGGYAFSKNTFGFSDGTDGDHLASVAITVLPMKGKLLLDGVAVTAGQEIAAGDLSDLVWQAGKHALSAKVKFTVTDDGGTEGGGKDTSKVHTLTFAITRDTFTGTDAGEKLGGTDGHDILIGKRGNDTLTGGDGPDTFVFKTGDGRDMITDFRPAEGDRIDLSDVDGITSYRDMVHNHLSERSGDLRIIDGDGDVIILSNVSADDLHKGDFAF